MYDMKRSILLDYWDIAIIEKVNFSKSCNSGE